VQGLFSGMDIEIADYAGNVIAKSFADTPDVDIAYTFSKMMEHIHQETYEVLNENIFRDSETLARVRNYWETDPGIAALKNWAAMLDLSKVTLAEAILIAI